MTIGIGNEGAMTVGQAKVVASQNTGLPIDHWAERLLERIVHVAGDSHPLIKDQAEAFRESIRDAIIVYMGHAIVSDRTTLYNMLLQQGETEMAEILRRL